MPIICYANYPGPKGEVYTLPSLTIPDQALSLETLITRYVRGGEVQVFPGVFGGDDLIPVNLERMDEIERIELARNIKASMPSAIKRLQDALSVPGESDEPILPVNE